MQALRKSPGERVEYLAWAYGGKAELARRLGVSRSTVYNWIKKDAIPRNFLRTISRRVSYFKNDKPREIMKLLGDPSDKVQHAADTGISLYMNSLMPFGFSVFAFDLISWIDDPRMQYVKKAFDLSVRLSATLSVYDEKGGKEHEFYVRDVLDMYRMYEKLRSIIEEIGSETAASVQIEGDGGLLE